MHSGQSLLMSHPLRDTPKRNWPLIWGGIVAALLLLGTVLGLVAMYIANFNLFDWLE
jgi:hypothetical protein